MMIDDSYGPALFLNAFFNDAPKTKDVGGWFFHGHNAKDEYQEIIVQKPILTAHDFDLVRDWIDWVRVPIPKGNSLLLSP